MGKDAFCPCPIFFTIFCSENRIRIRLYLLVGIICLTPFDLPEYKCPINFIQEKMIAMEQDNFSNDGPQSKLIDAAIALFSEKGYAATSVREIVELAGVSKPVLYYYFKNKEGLFNAILDEASAWQEEIIRDVLDSPQSATEKLLILYTHIDEAFQEHPDFFRFIHALILGLPQGNPAYDLERFHRRMIDLVREIYQQGRAKGEFLEADPEDFASLIMGVNDFCLHLECLNPEKGDSERPKRLLNLALKGLKNKD